MEQPALAPEEKQLQDLKSPRKKEKNYKLDGGGGACEPDCLCVETAKYQK